jgi:hypothetical protein
MDKNPPTLSTRQWGRPRLGEIASACWCGQDLECVQRAHCPRCGRARLMPSRTTALV